MKNNRPSLGEFRGYFNISRSDLRKISTKDWSTCVICDQATLPRLTKIEASTVKNKVADIFRNHGFAESDLEDYVECLWPRILFSVEPDQIDRTCRVWISSAKDLSFLLIQELIEILNQEFQLWRIVLRFPRGEQPDAIIYRDLARFGDTKEFSIQAFLSHRSICLQAEDESLPLRSRQLSQLDRAKPILFLNEQQTVFLMGVFPESIETPAPFLQTSTIWFGCTYQESQNQSHRITSLQIGPDCHEPWTASCPPGSLNTEGIWRFSPLRSAKCRCCFFLVPTPELRLSFFLYGKEEMSNHPWRIEASLPH